MLRKQIAQNCLLRKSPLRSRKWDLGCWWQDVMDVSQKAEGCCSVTTDGRLMTSIHWRFCLCVWSDSEFAWCNEALLVYSQASHRVIRQLQQTNCHTARHVLRHASEHEM